MEEKVIVLVVSQKMLEDEVSYEYWIKFPDNSVDAIVLKTSNINVGYRLEITVEEVDGKKRCKKINRIV